MDAELPVIDTIDPPPPVGDQTEDTVMEEDSKLVEQQAPVAETEYTTPPEQMHQDSHDATEQPQVSEDTPVSEDNPIKSEPETPQNKEQQPDTTTEVEPTTTSEVEPIASEIEPTASETKPTASEVEPVASNVEPVASKVEPITSEEIEPTAMEEIEPTAMEEIETSTEIKMEEPAQPQVKQVAESTTDCPPPFLSAPASWQIPVAALAQQHQQQSPQSQPQQKALEPVVVNKSHLRKERFETRIKESKYDVEAWTGLINDAQQTGDLEVIRDIYERFLNVFPTSVSLFFSFITFALFVH